MTDALRDYAPQINLTVGGHQVRRAFADRSLFTHALSRLCSDHPNCLIPWWVHRLSLIAVENLLLLKLLPVNFSCRFERLTFYDWIFEAFRKIQFWFVQWPQYFPYFVLVQEVFWKVTQFCWTFYSRCKTIFGCFLYLWYWLHQSIFTIPNIIAELLILPYFLENWRALSPKSVVTLVAPALVLFLTDSPELLVQVWRWTKIYLTWVSDLLTFLFALNWIESVTTVILHDCLVPYFGKDLGIRSTSVISESLYQEFRWSNMDSDPRN